MDRVSHLQKLAQSSRNLARDLPPDRAEALMRLADQYEREAEQRQRLIASGMIDVSDVIHPGRRD